jgi:hypothetical protein
MFGQSAVVAWLGYTIGEDAAKAFGASDDTAAAVAAIVGDAACLTTGVLTVDPVGIVAGTGLVYARSLDMFGDKEDAVGSVISALNTVAGIIFGGGGSTQPDSFS